MDATGAAPDPGTDRASAPATWRPFGRERAPFKLDVRKLKELGLTESLNPGYRLSPRGRSLVEAFESRQTRDQPAGGAAR